MERASGLTAMLKATALMAIGGIAAIAMARPAAPEPRPAPRLSAPMPAQTGPLAIAGALKPGLWEVRFTDAGGETVQRLCAADLSPLIQIRHPRAGCDRIVLTNDPETATVQYSCPGAGWGRTNLRAVGHDNVRIETQGVAGNAPFAFTAVGRRTGECGGIAQSH